MQPWSFPLTGECGRKQIDNAMASLARGFNAASSAQLAQALNHQVDFSMTGEPLPTFATHSRDEVLNYARARTTAGESVYPYLVYAASVGTKSARIIVAQLLVVSF